MKDFEFFVHNLDVKRQSVNSNLSISLINDSKKRLKYAKAAKLTKENAKYVYENAYESLREAADAILFLHGYKSYSHEATISFLQRFSEFSFGEIKEFDRTRKKRNGMKYYGEDAEIEETEESLKFCEKMLDKLLLLYSQLSKQVS